MAAEPFSGSVLVDEDVVAEQQIDPVGGGLDGASVAEPERIARGVDEGKQNRASGMSLKWLLGCSMAA